MRKRVIERERERVNGRGGNGHSASCVAVMKREGSLSFRGLL